MHSTTFPNAPVPSVRTTSSVGTKEVEVKLARVSRPGSERTSRARDESCDKDGEDAEDGSPAWRTSIFHHQADVIDQVPLFVVFAALSLATLPHSVIFGVDSIVTRTGRRRPRRAVIGLGDRNLNERAEAGPLRRHLA